MHQDGPSVSAKTRGRAVAYPPDVVTLASHTTAGKDQPTSNPARHHDQPTVTRPSSRRLAADMLTKNAADTGCGHNWSRRPV
jgi:hypothetical protein